MKEQINDIEKLRLELPHGGQKSIAERLGYTKVYVSMVLRGKSYNAEIIAEAIRIRDRHKRVLNQLNSAI